MCLTRVYYCTVFVQINLSCNIYFSISIFSVQRIKMVTIEDINKCIKNNNVKLAEKITTDIKIENEKIRTDLSTKIDEFANKFSTQIKTIESTSSVLQEKVIQLEDTVARLAKSNSLIIRNIPFINGEVLDRIFNEICNKIGHVVPMPFPKMFRANSRVNSQLKPISDQTTSRKLRNTKHRDAKASGSTRPLSESEDEVISSPLIFIKFAAEWQKIDFHRSYFKFGKLQLCDIGFQTPIQVIIAEDLTAENRLVFRAALNAKKRGLLSKVVTSYGTVCIYDLKNNYMKIKSVKELSEILKNYDNSDILNDTIKVIN